MGSVVHIRNGVRTDNGSKSPTKETLWLINECHVGQTLLHLNTYKGTSDFWRPDPYAAVDANKDLRAIRSVAYTFTGFDSANNLHLQRMEVGFAASDGIHSKHGIILRLSAGQGVSVGLFGASESDDHLVVELELQVIGSVLHAKYVGDLPRIETQ